MIEHVEELTVDTQLHMFRQLKPLGDIQVAPDEIGTAQSVSTKVAELAIRRAVTACTTALVPSLSHLALALHLEGGARAQD